MYANEEESLFYPPLTRYDGMWVPELERVYPEYLSDLYITLSRDHPKFSEQNDRLSKLMEEPEDWEALTELMAENFIYTSWLMRDVSDAQRLAAMRSQLTEGNYNKDLTDTHGTL